MATPTPIMIGIAVFVLFIIIIIAFAVSSGDETDPVEQAIDEGVSVRPKCETHTCPEGYELDNDGLGDTDAECCLQPFCDDSIVCDGNEVVQEGTRGLTKESCCQLPLCNDKVGGICNAEDKRLKNSDIRGVTDDECCDTLPTCGSHVCGPGYRSSPNPDTMFGDTDGECCVLKTCGENNWGNNDGRKCTLEGMKWDAGDMDNFGNAEDIAGNSADICCEPANCLENGFNDEKCSDPRRGGEYGLTALMKAATDIEPDPPEEMGKTHAECCATSKCSDESPVILCDRPGRTMKVPEPYATTEAECCEDIKCGDTFDTYKTENPGNTGHFCPLNMTPKGRDTSGTSQGECCNVKTCSDVDGSCLAGQSLIASRSIPDTTYDFEDHCCTDMLCTHPDSNYKTEAGCNEDVHLTGDLNPKISDLSNTSYALYKPKSTFEAIDANRGNCCEKKLCSQLTNLDCGKAGKKLNEDATLWDDSSAVNDGDDNDGGDNCCKPKTCADLEGGRTCDVGTTKIANMATDVTMLAVELSLGREDGADAAFKRTCCAAKTCAELDFDCAQVSVNGQTNVMEKNSANDDESPGETEVTGKCCKWKTCSANGWTDAICKDKTKVRAEYRGSLKTLDGGAATIGPPPTDRDLPDSMLGVPQAVPTSSATDSQRYTGGGWSVGDSNCCAQDDDNFARQCVGKEYHNNTYKRKSGGVQSSHHMGPVIGAETTGQDANTCMQKCKQNTSCNTFLIDQSGKCILRPAGDLASAADHATGHGGPTLRGVIGIELSGGASAADGKTRASHYVNKAAFEGWPGAVAHIGENPHMTGKPNMTGNDLNLSGVGGKTPTVSDFTNRAGDLTTAIDATTWIGRENVLLAGVDEEFCPYDFFQAYNHSKSAHAQAGSDAPSLPENIGMKTASLVAPSNGCHEMKNGSLSTQGGLNSCYSDPGCAAIWVNTSANSPWLTTPTHAPLRRTDTTSSRIFNGSRNVMTSTHSRWARRMCYKHHLSTDSQVTDPAANTNPGGFLVKTRYTDTRDSKKYIGRAPDKPTFATPFPVESKLLISGDTAV